MELSLGLAFVAGVISFISPCVLALLPVYLAYLGETAAAVGPIAARPAEGALARVALQPVTRQVALFMVLMGVLIYLNAFARMAGLFTWLL